MRSPTWLSMTSTGRCNDGIRRIVRCGNARSHSIRPLRRPIAKSATLHIDSRQNGVGAEIVVVVAGLWWIPHRLQVHVIPGRIAKDRELTCVLDHA